MKFPYGISDFYKLITEDYLYIDRTDRIPLLEEAGSTLLFLRPRRYGKSLLLSLLENYYDVAKAAEFDRLFGKLAIGHNPTPLHNRYLVMRWDFSDVAPHHNVDQMQQNLFDHINDRIKLFAQRYADILKTEIEISDRNAMISFRSALRAVETTPYKLYLLIDEYDNFANEVLMGGRPQSRERYEGLVFSEGDFKSVFKSVKAGGAGFGVDRVFIVGVSPVVLHDVTSGFNIAENIYFREDLNDLCGFTEAEVATMLQRTGERCGLSTEKIEEALTLMRIFYNGSQFSEEGTQAIYNPTAVFYFLKNFERTCRYPRRLLDSNLAPDYQKISYISQLPNGEQLILAALDEAKPLSVTTLEDRFGIRQILAESNTETFMASLLYYLGVLTLGGINQDGKLILQIPNLVIQGLYAERLAELLLPDAQEREEGKRATETLYQQGDIRPLCDFIEQRIFPVFDNRDYIQANELTIKTAFLTMLFNDTFYVMDSEPALQRSYADLTMILRPEMRRFQLLDLLVEFKFVKLSELTQSGVVLRQMDRNALLALDPVKAKLAEAKTQLPRYRKTLTQKYGSALRLRTYAVIAIGFERLIWLEI
jgi:hypothetical protein